MKNKIELNILFFIITEGFILLFFPKISFLNIIIGSLISIILIMISKRFDINKFRYLLLAIVIPFIIIVFYKIIIFIQDIYLNNFSLIIIGFSFLIVSLYLISNGYHTFIKVVEISGYLLLFIKILSFILSINLIDISNINNNYFLTINSNFIYFGLSIFLLYQCINYLFSYQLKIKTITLSIVNPFLIIILSNIIIGNSLFNIYKYPYVKYLQRIKYFDFIERMEGLLSFEYLYSFVILFTFLLFLVKYNRKKSH